MKVKDIWAITHQAVVTDTIAYRDTHVKAETAEKALSFFNEEIADDCWIYKAEIVDVRQLEVHEAK